MASNSTIEWCDATWNPVVGCKAVSPGCDHCYAAREASGRLSGNPTYAGLAEGGVFTGEVRLLPERLEQPLHWKQPRRIFVNSMSDLFHPDVPLDFLRQVWEVMVRAHRERGHVFQVLTKRPQRMAKALGPEGIGWYAAEGPVPCPEPGIWLGTSVESQQYAFRVRHLLDTPAAVRFVSAEPLLGPLDLSEYMPPRGLAGPRIDWVIVGGESGPAARPMDADWARSLRDQCQATGIAFHFKQWGEWIPYEDDPQPPFLRSQHGAFLDGHHLPSTISDMQPVDGWWWPDVESPIFRKVGKKAAGRLLDGRAWDEYPDADPPLYPSASHSLCDGCGATLHPDSPVTSDGRCESCAEARA